MPLVCNCYSGCWEAHSKHWPTVKIGPSDFLRHSELARVADIPHGSYVTIGNEFRCETQSYKQQAERALGRE